MVLNNQGRSCDWECESVTLSEMCRSHCPTLEVGACGFGATRAQVPQQVPGGEGMESSDSG